MSESKLTYIVPAAATIIAAVIAAYALITANQVKSRDLGSPIDGQKICVVAKTGIWHSISVVPKIWTVSMCDNLRKPFDGDAFYIGCAFNDETIFSKKNDPAVPARNCGW